MTDPLAAWLQDFSDAGDESEAQASAGKTTLCPFWYNSSELHFFVLKQAVVQRHCHASDPGDHHDQWLIPQVSITLTALNVRISE